MIEKAQPPKTEGTEIPRHSPSFDEWVQAWWRTRNLYRLLAGSASLLAFLALLAYWLFQKAWKPAHAGASCYEMASQAFGRADFETARVAYLGLLKFSDPRQPEHIEYTYKLGQSYLRLGRAQEGEALVSMLAPLDKPGYTPAHMYLATNLLASTNANLEIIKTAETHLIHIVTTEPANVQAHEFLSQIYAFTDRWDLARHHLMAVVPDRSEAALPLAVALRAQGDEASARDWADRAARYFRIRAEHTKRDDPVGRVNWARALMIQRDFATAYTVLEEGWKQSTNKLYLPVLGDVCAAWARTLAVESPKDIARRLELVEKGLQFITEHAALLSELVLVSALPDPAAQAAREKVEKLLAPGQESGLLHYALGSLAWERGEVEKARFHCSRAYELSPHVPGVANNMALFLQMGDKPDLPRALEIIEEVLKRFPDNPGFIDTRGQILAKMGRYHEALRDLEFSLPLLESKAETHQAMAEVYQKLGMTNLAAEHARLAKLRTPIGPSAPGRQLGQP